ncbi:MAG TPA: hypothetical protein VK879_10420 [Candidatus Sulfomarinibacteraceae bacterium]|nr:hypothetical protein [Candidatus Sulfomarinibacteraceae bacterium]
MLLPGFYDEWLLLERERLQALFERRVQQLLDGPTCRSGPSVGSPWATRRNRPTAP